VPPPTSGSVRLQGVDLSTLDTDELRDARGRLQMIFQDAISSLNPRRRIRDVVAEPLMIRWLESFKRSPVFPGSSPLPSVTWAKTASAMAVSGPPSATC
jgi:peptide/nickel transport system ATP-binding protein